MFYLKSNAIKKASSPPTQANNDFLHIPILKHNYCRTPYSRKGTPERKLPSALFQLPWAQLSSSNKKHITFMGSFFSSLRNFSNHSHIWNLSKLQGSRIFLYCIFSLTITIPLKIKIIPPNTHSISLFKN